MATLTFEVCGVHLLSCMHAFSVCLDRSRSFEVLKAFTLVLLSVKIVSRAMLKEAATCGRLAFGFASIACKSDITWWTAFDFLSPTPVASHPGPYTISNLQVEAFCSLRLLRTWKAIAAKCVDNQLASILSRTI